VVISGPAAQTRMLIQGDAERVPGIAHPTSRHLSVVELRATKGGTTCNPVSVYTSSHSKSGAHLQALERREVEGDKGRREQELVHRQTDERGASAGARRDARVQAVPVVQHRPDHEEALRNRRQRMRHCHSTGLAVQHRPDHEQALRGGQQRVRRGLR